MLSFKKLFCDHDYHLINQFQMKSEFDIIVENGHVPKTYNGITRKVISDYKCSKCNKIKRLKVRTQS